MKRNDIIAAVEAVPLGPQVPILICGNCGGRDTFTASTAFNKVHIVCATCGHVYEFDRET